MELRADKTILAPALAYAGDADGFATFEHLVTVPLTDYRELCGKAALWDEYRADAERWCEGGDA